MNQADPIQKIKPIKTIYDKLTYFDTYGQTLMLFIFVCIVWFGAICYCFAMIQSAPIKADWINQRCKPSVIPFAGFINKPDNMTITEFTAQNFADCIQSITSNISGDAVQPLTYVTQMISELANKLSEDINSMRDMINNIRSAIQHISAEIMGRIMNVTVPLRVIIIGVQDTMNKLQGGMTAMLMTVLGTYYTLKALVGGIANFILKILLLMTIMILMYFSTPFTLIAAIALSLVYAGIAIPFSYVLGVMVDSLKIHLDIGFPKKLSK